jgi:hypothetical protein
MGRNEGIKKGNEMKKTIWIASDNTRGQHYTVETDLTDIVDIAYKYGRAETGEIVQCDGETAGWDDSSRKYRRQLPDGRWEPDNWGGRREGAGRPATGRKKRTYYVTDEENEALRKYLEELRQ